MGVDCLSLTIVHEADGDVADVGMGDIDGELEALDGAGIGDGDGGADALCVLVWDGDGGGVGDGHEVGRDGGGAGTDVQGEVLDGAGVTCSGVGDGEEPVALGGLAVEVAEFVALVDVVVAAALLVMEGDGDASVLEDDLEVADVGVLNGELSSEGGDHDVVGDGEGVLDASGLVIGDLDVDVTAEGEDGLVDGLGDFGLEREVEELLDLTIADVGVAASVAQWEPEEVWVGLLGVADPFAADDLAGSFEFEDHLVVVGAGEALDAAGQDAVVVVRRFGDVVGVHLDVAPALDLGAVVLLGVGLASLAFEERDGFGFGEGALFEDAIAEDGLIPDLVAGGAVFGEGAFADTEHVGDDDVEGAGVGVAALVGGDATGVFVAHDLFGVAASAEHQGGAAVVGGDHERFDVADGELDAIDGDGLGGLWFEDGCRNPSVAEAPPTLHAVVVAGVITALVDFSIVVVVDAVPGLEVTLVLVLPDGGLAELGVVVVLAVLDEVVHAAVGAQVEWLEVHVGDPRIEGLVVLFYGRELVLIADVGGVLNRGPIV